MKKYIALFSLVAVAVMAVALTGNAASTCSISKNVGDDYFATCSAKKYVTFNASNTSNVDFNSTTVNVSNSGANILTAGDDMENAHVTTGGAEATSEASYDVASNDIVYAMDDSGTDTAIELNTELEDAVLVAEAEEANNETVSNFTNVTATETDVLVGNTGANVATAGDDNEGTTLSTGASKTSSTKSWFVGYQRIYRNAPAP